MRKIDKQLSSAKPFKGFWIVHPSGKKFYVPLSSAECAKMTDREIRDFMNKEWTKTEQKN